MKLLEKGDMRSSYTVRVLTLFAVSEKSLARSFMWAVLSSARNRRSPRSPSAWLALRTAFFMLPLRAGRAGDGVLDLTPAVCLVAVGGWRGSGLRRGWDAMEAVRHGRAPWKPVLSNQSGDSVILRGSCVKHLCM